MTAQSVSARRRCVCVLCVLVGSHACALLLVPLSLLALVLQTGTATASPARKIVDVTAAMGGCERVTELCTLGEGA